MGESRENREEREMKKPGRKPSVVYSPKTEARAVPCAKSGETCSPNGPIFS
jgi:hypothetical protein